MNVNIIFQNVKIYSVQDLLDVIVGQTFLIEVIDAPEGMDVFSNHDPVLSIAGDNRTVTTSLIGDSLIKFEVGDSVVKKILINVVSGTGPNATTLNGSLGEPVLK